MQYDKYGKLIIAAAAAAISTLVATTHSLSRKNYRKHDGATLRQQAKTWWKNKRTKTEEAPTPEEAPAAA